MPSVLASIPVIFNFSRLKNLYLHCVNPLIFVGHRLKNRWFSQPPLFFSWGFSFTNSQNSLSSRYCTPPAGPSGDIKQGSPGAAPRIDRKVGNLEIMGGNIIEPFNTNIYLHMAIWENYLKNHAASECLGW